MYKFCTNGVCAKEIEFDVENGKLTGLHFVGGCPGNLQAICKLVEGAPIAEVAEKLQGIVCRNATSCADQLATALKQMMTEPGELPGAGGQGE